jgi:hypothetical protein
MKNRQIIFRFQLEPLVMSLPYTARAGALAATTSKRVL